jgi:hypothetical protein
MIDWGISIGRDTMIAQALILGFGCAAAGFMAYNDYRQNKTPESFLGALFTLGLVASAALAIAPQA